MATSIEIVKQYVLKTEESWVPLILRVLLALVVFPHGAQKLFGAFGGYGWDGTLQYFSEVIGIPYAVGVFIILLETVGALFLLVGIVGRLLALGYTFLALGIVLTSHIEHGFFMNWYGAQAGEGIEYFLLWLAISGSLVISGSGKFSLDYFIWQKKGAM